jgi:hypothetical protein
MRFKMGGIDDEPVWRSCLSGKACENPVEDAHTAPADEPVIQGLMRAILSWSIAPAKAVFDDEHDPAHNATIIDARPPCDRGK